MNIFFTCYNIQMYESKKVANITISVTGFTLNVKVWFIYEFTIGFGFNI